MTLVKKYSLASLVCSLAFLSFFSCTKINEATEIGDGLIPPVDNVNTFEVELAANTLNEVYNDSSRVGLFDPVAIGDINDPRFGNMHANFAFSMSLASTYGVWPFKYKKDSIHTIDSVVLSLAYAGAYGDTLGNGIQTISVYEIGQSEGFRSDTSYRYTDPASDFNGSLLGTRTYSIKDDTDSALVQEPGDTAASWVKNVLRIKLNNSLGLKFTGFDTSVNGPINGFRNDSLFKVYFPGLSVKASNSGNAFAYYNLADASGTRLTVYYKYKHNGTDTVGSVSFIHSSFGQANYVNVQQGGLWAAAINNPAADQMYINGSPSGANGKIFFPGLSTFGNKVIHRAELISPVVDAGPIFTAPQRLFLDRFRDNKALNFDNDLNISFTGNNWVANYDIFGGNLKSGAYKFNITRYVQGIVTRNEPNDTLRVHAPLRTLIYVGPYNTDVPLNVLPRIGEGRVVLGGGSYPDPARRTRLRIIYSNL